MLHRAGQADHSGAQQSDSWRAAAIGPSEAYLRQLQEGQPSTGDVRRWPTLSHSRAREGSLLRNGLVLGPTICSSSQTTVCAPPRKTTFHPAHVLPLPRLFPISVKGIPILTAVWVQGSSRPGPMACPARYHSGWFPFQEPLQNVSLAFATGDITPHWSAQRGGGRHRRTPARACVSVPSTGPLTKFLNLSELCFLTIK